MRIPWKIEWLNWTLIAAMFLLTALAWGSAPARLPVHWNWAGQIDGYGGKTEVMLGYPFGTLLLYLLLLVLPRVDPGRANYARFSRAYSAVRLAIVAGAAAIYTATLLAGLGFPIDTSKVVLTMVGALLMVLGNFMGKLRPNWFVGIRTPWTLSSRTSWTKTHRLGGWVFIVTGLSLIVAALLQAQWAFLASFSLLGLGVIWLTIYSYLVWRTDPNRVPPAGSRPE